MSPDSRFSIRILVTQGDTDHDISSPNLKNRMRRWRAGQSATYACATEGWLRVWRPVVWEIALGGNPTTATLAD